MVENGLMLSHISAVVAPRKSLTLTLLLRESNVSYISVITESPAIQAVVLGHLSRQLSQLISYLSYYFLCDIFCCLVFYIFCMVFSSNFV